MSSNYAHLLFAFNNWVVYWQSNNGGASWQNSNDFPYSNASGVAISASGSYVHIAFVTPNGVYYARSSNNGSDWTPAIKISNTVTAIAPVQIAADPSGNAYIVWSDNRSRSDSSNYEIYFQKIPVNFARVTGTVKGAAIRVDTQPITTLAATLEVPLLIAPENKKENVQSLRPTFEWKHKKGSATEYKLDIAKDDLFSIAKQSFTKSANSGSVDNKTDPTLYFYNYTIHEFDPGLDRDTYFWKVTALTTNEAATSKVWSFTIKPDLTISGITNYPNPFNPNSEKTKIRYRLSTDANEVKIRIYDITGSLVTELDGTTAGESSSIWGKYNDREWDGRNGRGDLVVNGIYPFEVVARLGDRSVSGRGKIAVLK
jgi:hypothetical protein